MPASPGRGGARSRPPGHAPSPADRRGRDAPFATIAPRVPADGGDPDCLMHTEETVRDSLGERGPRGPGVAQAPMHSDTSAQAPRARFSPSAAGRPPLPTSPRVANLGPPARSRRLPGRFAALARLRLAHVRGAGGRDAGRQPSQAEESQQRPYPRGRRPAAERPGGGSIDGPQGAPVTLRRIGDERRGPGACGWR